MLSRKCLFLASFCVALLVQMDLPAVAQQIRVAAAADLAPVMKRLVPAFESSTGVKVEVASGSSGSLFAQITNGGPYDVFLSADIDYARKLQDSGSAVPGSLRKYAQGRLALVVKRGIEGQDAVTILSSTAIGKVAIANPKHAPYGRAAVGWLESNQLAAKLQSRLVMGENVAQTAQFVLSGNADAALVGMSHARELAKTHRVIQLPDNSYPAIEQAGVVISSSTMKREGAQLLEFLLSPPAQAIFGEFGFKPPAQDKP